MSTRITLPLSGTRQKAVIELLASSDSRTRDLILRKIGLIAVFERLDTLGEGQCRIEDLVVDNARAVSRLYFESDAAHEMFQFFNRAGAAVKNGGKDEAHSLAFGLHTGLDHVDGAHFSSKTEQHSGVAA